MQRYQEWSYRVGLAGIVVVALLFGLRIAQRPNHIGEVHAGGTTSTIPGDGNPTSTTAAAAVPFSIVSPADGARVNSPLLTIVGVGDTGDKITWGTVTTTVDANRTWVLNIGLQPGANKITITASDNTGQSSSLTITIYLDASATTTIGAAPSTSSGSSSGGGRTTTTRKCAATVEAGYVVPFETTTTESHGSTTTTTTVDSTTTTTTGGSTTTTVSHGSTTTTTAPQTTTTRKGC